jgi:hypothetical protein
VALSLRFELGTTDPEGLAAALVHDVIEDGPGWTLDRLRAEVGERVTNMAAALTEDSTLERPHRYMVYWQALGAAEETARLVKIADRVDNLRDALALPGATVEFLRRNLFRTRMRFIPFLEEHATPGAELVDAACADIERRVAELEGRDPNASPLCPVCGWDLGHSVATIAPGIVCPSCGFTFGADAQALSPAQSHARWRWDWLQAGAPWRGGADPPMGWNPLAQLKRIGVEPPPAL